MTLSVARLTCWGVVGTGTLISSPQNGMTLHALVNRFDVGDQLHVDGCQLDLALKPNTTPNIVLKGRASLLDIAADVDIAMSDAGFRFNISGAIFGQLRAALLVSGQNFPSGKDIQVQAQVDTAWLNQFKDSAALAVLGAGAGRPTVRSSRRSSWSAINSATTQPTRRRSPALARRSFASSSAIKRRWRPRDAMSNRHWPRSARWDRDQRHTRHHHCRARARSAAAGCSAKAALVGPQNDVNRLNNEINATNGWFYSLPKTDWPWKPSQAREGRGLAPRWRAFTPRAKWRRVP